MAAQNAAVDSTADSVRDREIAVEQTHLDRVYRRLEEKIHEAEFLMNDAAKRGQVGTPGALAERDAQVFRAGIHLNRLNNEFEDFLFGRVDLVLGKDGERGADGAYTSVEPADDAIREDLTADIAETLHIGRIGVLDSDYAPLVIDWRAPAAAPFYRSTPKEPGRVVRRRVIRSKGRKVLGVEDDLMRPEVTAFLDGQELPAIGDGALMAALGRARTHSMRDIVSSIQAEQDLVIRAPAASVAEVAGGPGTGKTAVALHRAAYLLYQDRRRYSGGILIVSPTPLLVAYTEGVLPSLGEEGQVAIRALGSLVDGAEATTYDSPAVARIKGSSRMLKVLRKAVRGALELGGAPDRLRVVAFGRRQELEADELNRIRQNVLSGTAPVNLLRPRARKLLLDALYAKSGGAGRHSDPELAAELRSAFDEDISTEDAFIGFLDAWWPELTPRAVLAALADERHLGRWSRRDLGPRESRQLARSLRRVGPTARAPCRCTTWRCWTSSSCCWAPRRGPSAARDGPARPAQRVGGADADPRGDAVGAGRAARGGAHRVRARHRGRGPGPDADAVADGGPPGRHGTWTVVGDPAQSSWTDPEEAAAARRGPRVATAPAVHPDGQLPQPGRGRRGGLPRAAPGDARHGAAVGGAFHGSGAPLHGRRG